MKYVAVPEIGDGVKLLDGTETCIGSDLVWKPMIEGPVFNMSFRTCDDKKIAGYFKAFDHKWKQVPTEDLP